MNYKTSRLSVFALAVGSLFAVVFPLFAQTDDFKWNAYLIIEKDFNIHSPVNNFKNSGWVNGQCVVSAFDPKHDFMVGVTETHLQGKYLEFPLSEYPGKVLKALEAKLGGSEFKTDSRSVTIGSQPAIMTDTTYLDGKRTSRKIKELDIKNGGTWWGILIMYPGEDGKLDQTADNVLRSFRFKIPDKSSPKGWVWSGKDGT